MEYVISSIDNKDKFLGVDKFGRYTTVTNIKKSKLFSDKTKAENVIKNSLSKVDQLKWYVKENVKPKPKASKTPKVCKIASVSKEIDNDILHNDYSFWEDQIHKFKSCIETERNNLSEQLSVADLEMSDIYHYIGENNPNAAKRTKIYKVLQTVVQKRKIIKEQIRCADIFLSDFDNNFNIEDVFEKFKTVEYKPYNPRTNVYDMLVEM